MKAEVYKTQNLIYQISKLPTINEKENLILAEVNAFLVQSHNKLEELR
jgi:hypothetical protein